MCIFVIIISAYGVMTQSALHPGQPFNFQLLRNVINKGYWSIFGDFRLSNEFILDPACSKRGDCDLYPQHAGTYFTFFSFMVYCVIANVLLINLLIAMFRYERFNYIYSLLRIFLFYKAIPLTQFRDLLIKYGNFSVMRLLLKALMRQFYRHL
jgi:hypothetical protein